MDFKTEHYSIELTRKINSLKTLDFIRNHENLILIGNPGTGKTHLASALGMQACINEMNVLFISIPNLFTSLFPCLCTK